MLDPATLLCERCGYIIDGLPESEHCPECGKPVIESLPEHRIGSACQNDPRASKALITCGQMLVRPAAVFDLVRTECPANISLRAWLLALAAAVWVVPPLASVVLAICVSNSAPGVALFGVLALAIGVPVAWLLAFLFLAILTLIGRTGVQMFGHFRGWRLSRDVADSVCVHACAGWVAGSAASLFCLLLGVLVGAADVGTGIRLAIVGEFAGFAIGVLWFGILAWVGVGRCRFANRPPVPLRS